MGTGTLGAELKERGPMKRKLWPLTRGGLLKGRRGTHKITHPPPAPAVTKPPPPTTETRACNLPNWNGRAGWGEAGRGGSGGGATPNKEAGSRGVGEGQVRAT